MKLVMLCVLIDTALVFSSCNAENTVEIANEHHSVDPRSKTEEVGVPGVNRAEERNEGKAEDRVPFVEPRVHDWIGSVFGELSRICDMHDGIPSNSEGNDMLSFKKDIDGKLYKYRMEVLPDGTYVVELYTHDLVIRRKGTPKGGCKSLFKNLETPYRTIGKKCSPINGTGMQRCNTASEILVEQ